MKAVVKNLVNYFATVPRTILVIATLFIAGFIYINYHYHLNHRINSLPEGMQFLGWMAVFLSAFSTGYMLLYLFRRRDFVQKKFLLLLVIAPAIFAWKMCWDVSATYSTVLQVNAYWNQVVYWPLKLLVVTTMLFIVWRTFDHQQPFYGVTFRDFKPGPYVMMLLIMIPLVAVASTQPDFLAMYPKLKNIHYLNDRLSNGWYKLLYELSYGSDFFTIELFFRGFLIMAFAKWVGKDAILPMALFYCTIHFGKPLGECISSYFGGMILGVVIYHNRTIFGGLMVHLGIAWLMELGGYLGNLYFGH